MSLVIIDNWERSVWESNKDLLSLSAFSELKEEYGEEKADLIIKAHYVWLDPKWKLRKQFSEKKRKEEAEDKWLSKAEVTWSDVSEFTDFYRNHCLTLLAKRLLEMEEMIDDRYEYMKNLSYEKDQKTKDAMFKTHPEFQNKLEELRGLVEEENSTERSMRGGYEKSFLEKFSSG